MKVIQKLHPNKAHGQDNISIRMIKICGKSVCIPLREIFEECLKVQSYISNFSRINKVSSTKHDWSISFSKFQSISPGN